MKLTSYRIDQDLRPILIRGSAFSLAGPTSCFECNKLSIKNVSHVQKMFIRKNSNYFFYIRKI